MSTTALGQELLFPGNIAGFTLKPNVTQQKAKALIGGKRLTVASQITEEEWTLELTFEYLDWSTLQFVFDERAAKAQPILWNEVKTVRVPSIAPYEIADPDIIAANASTTTAYLSSKGTWGKPKFLKNTGATAPADATEVSVNSTTSKLIFNAALAGAIITYQTPVAKTVESIGDTAIANRFGALTFSGLAYTTETAKPIGIVVPQITRNSAPTMTVTGEKSTFTVTFDATVPQGARSPYRLFNFDSIV